jgi:hypothetical protein
MLLRNLVYLVSIYLEIVAVVLVIYGSQLRCSCTAAIVNKLGTVTGPRAKYTLADLEKLREGSKKAKERREEWADELLEKEEDIKKNEPIPEPYYQLIQPYYKNVKG